MKTLKTKNNLNTGPENNENNNNIDYFGLHIIFPHFIHLHLFNT